jgi:phosphatidylserine/phosphatidylglycerophosphate/cardiolipin synthase-like enzyme
LRILVSVLLTILLILPATTVTTHGHKASSVRLLRDNQFYHVLSDHIEGATHEVVVSMFLFKTNPHSSSRANLILEDLIAAQKRGVQVRVLLERTNRRDASLDRENRATSRRLRRNGVQVLFDSPDTTTHTKTIVIDERFLFIGSHNLTHSALFYNHELSVLIDDPNLAREVIRYLKKLET